jgi:hypothetical protein
MTLPVPTSDGFQAGRNAETRLEWRFSDLPERGVAAGGAVAKQGGSFGGLEPHRSSTLLPGAPSLARLATFELLWLHGRVDEPPMTAGRRRSEHIAGVRR